VTWLTLTCDVQEETLDERGGRTIAYYQWTPLILLLQAFLFYAPCGVWRAVGDNSGIDVGNLIESGQLIATVQMEANVRKKIVRKMVTQVNRSAMQCISSSVILQRL